MARLGLGRMGIGRLHGNAAMLLGARLTSAVTTLVVLVLVSRLRGVEALGALGLGLAVGAIAAAVSELGSNALLIRQVSRRRDAAGDYLGAAMVLRLLTVPIALAGASLVAQLISPPQAAIVVLAAAGLILQQTVEATRSTFIAWQRMTVSSAHAVVENLLWLTVVAAGLVAGLSLTATLALALLVWIGSLAAGFVLLARLLHVRPVWPDRAWATAAFRDLPPFSGFAVINMTYSRIDPLLIGLLAAGPALAAAGAYFAAARLLAAFEYLAEAVSRAIYPELSRIAVGDRAAAVPLLRSASSLLLAVGLAVPAVLIPAGSWAMTLLFGAEPGEYGWVLGFLALAVPIRYLGYLYGVSLTSADAQSRRLAAVSLGLLLVVAIDAIGIPRAGLAAPVVAAIVGATVVLVSYGLMLERRFGRAAVVPANVGSAVLGAIVATAAGLAARVFLPEVLAAGVAALLYAAIIALGRVRSTLAQALAGTPDNAPNR
jgi:O-antigen/teichoic acid export membrane protein